MALLEHEAQRFAVALDDLEHVSVPDIGGTDGAGFWVVGHDHRVDVAFEISSQLDYWDFIFRLAVGRPAHAATLAAHRRAADSAPPAAASTAKATA